MQKRKRATKTAAKGGRSGARKIGKLAACELGRDPRALRAVLELIRLLSRRDPPS